MVAVMVAVSVMREDERLMIVWVMVVLLYVCGYIPAKK